MSLTVRIKEDEHKGVWEQKAEGRKATFSKTPDSNKKVHNSQLSLPDTINLTLTDCSSHVIH